MVRISDRLRTVAHMCDKGAVVADIGTDHGYLPIYLVQEGIAPSAIAMDLRKGPLDKAKKHISDNCLEDKIQTRLSDGLEKLSENEADIITICGMGGRLIADIVTKGMNVITQNTTLIVSPQSEVGDFRHFLVSQGFTVVDEQMLKEDGKYYFIIKCRKSDESVRPEYSETQYEYGWKLLEKRDRVLYEYIVKEKAVNEGISNGLKKDESNPTVKLRLQQLSKKNNIIMDALSYYD
ncbi:MAG: class I SAM-dependent methyltransferase [Eubacteriales bacterium]|nr:class I SAM-dependent methyltransferase [Eubacteriales bacterium]